MQLLLSKLVKGQMGSGACCEAMSVLLIASATEMDVFLRDGGIQQLCEWTLRPSQTPEAHTDGLELILLAARHLCDNSLLDNGAPSAVLCSLALYLRAPTLCLVCQCRHCCRPYLTVSALPEQWHR